MRQRTAAAVGFDYQVARDNSEWTDHRARSLVTAGLIDWLAPTSLLDPACGDGSIAVAAHRLYPMTMTLADVSIPNMTRLREYPLPGVTLMTKDIELTLAMPEAFDVIVLTEILEHLIEPEVILRRARVKARRLVVSSPEMRVGQQDTNAEHLWQFDGDGYWEMLKEAGWYPYHKTHLSFHEHEYDYQIWVCR